MPVGASRPPGCHPNIRPPLPAAPLDNPEHLCYNDLRTLVRNSRRKEVHTTNTKNSFILYTDYAKYFAALTREERGDLITAIFEYQAEGIEPEQLSPPAQMAFMFIRDQLDRDGEKYERICERNRKNGMLGGRPPKTKRVILEPEKPDNDTDNDNDNVTDTDTEGVAVGSGVTPTAGGGKKREKKKKEKTGSFDVDEFFEAALRRSYGTGFDSS